DYIPPDQAEKGTWVSLESTPELSREPVLTNWWTVFSDPLLEVYIDQAALGNRNLEVARANVRRARALRREARAGFFPDINATGRGTREGTSGEIAAFGQGTVRSFYDATFDASWGVDIFGGVRRASEAATARLQGAV